MRFRPALRQLQTDIGLEHALASRTLYTDGAELLFDYGEHHPGSDEARLVRNLVVVRNGQRVFVEVIEAYLGRIRYAADGYVALIRVRAYEHAQVVADPTRAFGVPIGSRTCSVSHPDALPDLFLDRSLGAVTGQPTEWIVQRGSFD